MNKIFRYTISIFVGIKFVLQFLLGLYREKRMFAKNGINYKLYKQIKESFDTGQYSMAINYTQQMIDDLDKNRIINDDVKFLSKLGFRIQQSGNHSLLGNFSKCNLILLDLLEEIEEKKINDDELFIYVKQNLAFSYLTEFRYSKRKETEVQQEQLRNSINLFQQAVDILERLHCDQPTCDNEAFLSKTYMQLGIAYQCQQNYDRAKQAYWKAIEYYLRNAKRFFGDKYSLELQNLLTNGLLFYRFDSPFKNWNDILQVWGETLTNMGSLYYEMGKYMDAERLYLEALSIQKKISDPEKELTENLVKKGHGYQFLRQVEHPNLEDVFMKLAQLLAAKNKPKESLEYIKKIDRILGYKTNQIFLSSSETDRLAFIQTQKYYFNVILSIIWGHLSQDSEALQFAVDFVLKRKAVTASALAIQNETLYSDCYPHLTDKFKELRTLSGEIVKLTYSSSPAQQAKLNKLQDKFNTLQRQLAEEIPEIQLEQDLQTADRRAVACNLPEDSVLIEFVRFDVYDFKAIPANGEDRLNPPRYIAFILPAGQPGQVKIVDLGEAAEIDKIVAEFLSSITDSRSESMGMFNPKPVERLLIKKYDPETLLRVSEALLMPILSKVEKAKHLLFAPDSDLNLIPFATLPIDSTGQELLIDSHLVSYLSVGRDVLRFNVGATRPVSEPVIIADPDFDLASSETNEEQIIESSSEQQSLIETLGGRYFRSLPDTRIIGQQIAEILPKSLFYQGEEALEARIVNIKCPGILFFITHGVFISESSQQRVDNLPISPSSNMNVNPLLAEQVENPMMRSLLALAGANTWLSGGKVPEDSKGVLFAQDILSLDLWGTEMVGLVACETGVGETSTGEGVFGMRRAFAVAGAETLIMSLWKVPARVTTLLMNRFLNNLKEERIGKSEALQEAQKYVRDINIRQLKQTNLGIEILKELSGEQKIIEESFKDKEDEQPLKHPYYWAAWICQGKTTPVAQFQHENNNHAESYAKRKS